MHFNVTDTFVYSPKRSVISPSVENETKSTPTGPDRHGMEWLSNENHFSLYGGNEFFQS